jgi:hypothetical protein
VEAHERIRELEAERDELRATLERVRGVMREVDGGWGESVLGSMVVADLRAALEPGDGEGATRDD